MEEIRRTLERLEGLSKAEDGHDTKIKRLISRHIALAERIDLLEAPYPALENQRDHVFAQLDLELNRSEVTRASFAEEIVLLQNHLNAGFLVSSLKSLETLTAIWERGVDGFNLNVETSLDEPRLRVEFGEDLNFDLWTKDCESRSNEYLQEQQEKFETCLARNVDILERATVLRQGIDTIIAEFRRRDVLAEKERSDRAAARQESYPDRRAD